MLEKVFAAEAPGRSLSTAELFKRVGKLAGRSVPEHSVRSALRTLVRRKVVRQRRSGREMFYTMGGPTPAPVEAPAPVAAPPVVVKAETVTAGAAEIAVPHKLGVGEALVLKVSDEHIEAVTNVHGQLVVQRHPRSKRAPA